MVRLKIFIDIPVSLTDSWFNKICVEKTIRSYELSKDRHKLHDFDMDFKWLNGKFPESWE
jgi:hypothetical protein